MGEVLNDVCHLRTVNIYHNKTFDSKSSFNILLNTKLKNTDYESIQTSLMAYSRDAFTSKI